jgi:hypothetical protein
MNRTFQMMADGRSGVVAAGTVKLVDAQNVQANSRDYPIQIGLAGPTAARPKAGDADFLTGLPAGLRYLDTTLGIVVVHDGTGAFRHPITGAAV